MLQKTSVRTKIWILVGTLVIFALATVLGFNHLVSQVRQIGLSATDNIMMEGHKRELKELVHSMAQSLAASLAGQTGPAAEETIRKNLEPVRFSEDKSGYFFAYTYEGVVVSVPPKPELTGKDLSGAQDQKGNFFLKDLIAAARKGGDYTEYYFDKPGKGLQPKLAYAAPIPGTQWWVGTGVYIDNVEEDRLAIQQEMDAMIRSFLGKLTIFLSVLFAAAVVPLTLMIVRSIVGPLKELQGFIEQVGTGNLRATLSGNFGGEFGRIKTAIQNMISKLREWADLVHALASGDLSRDVAVNREDELGKSLREMVDNLNSMLSRIVTSTEQIAAGSSQVSEVSQALSQNATEQASSLEEISASMQEMAAQTKTNAENATQANRLSSQAQAAAEQGNTRMQEMVGAMNQIEAASQNISKIIKTIDEIAFQTNLLALNAAVEAARAGQHGKGFAVVAEEVRSLAARSAKAAKETAALIEGSAGLTLQGAQIADQTATALQEIVGEITAVNDLVSEIAAASNEQAQGIAQVNQGLGMIDQVTQQNTANAEESAAASEELSSQAENLRQMLGRFTLKQQALHRPSIPAPAQSRSLPDAPGRNPSLHGKRAAAQLPRPEKLITLDDSEFGKY